MNNMKDSRGDLKDQMDYMEDEREYEVKHFERLFGEMLDFLIKYNIDKKAEGLIPTVDMLIEDLKQSI